MRDVDATQLELPVIRRKTAPGLREAKRLAKQREIEQRARLSGIGVEFTKRRAKYNQTKATYNGESFDSLGEAEYAHRLDLRKAAGEIARWERPPSIVLLDAPKVRDRITYTADFLVWYADGRRVYIDFKGSSVNPRTGRRRTPTATQAFSLRVRLWKNSVPFELRVAYSDGVEKVLAYAHPV